MTFIRLNESHTNVQNGVQDITGSGNEILVVYNLGYVLNRALGTTVFFGKSIDHKLCPPEIKLYLRVSWSVLFSSILTNRTPVRPLRASTDETFCCRPLFVIDN